MTAESWLSDRWRFWFEVFGRRPPVMLWILGIGVPALYEFLGEVLPSAQANAIDVSGWVKLAYFVGVTMLWFESGAAATFREMEDRLEDSKPRLTGFVEWHRLGRLLTGERVLLAALRIDNTGAKTKVLNWRMVTRPNTPEQNKPDISLDEPTVTVATDDGFDIVCQMSQYLPIVLNRKRLGKTYRQGFVIFNVETEPNQDDEITYTYRDQQQTLFSDTKRRIANGGDIKSFPPELVVRITPSTSRRATPSQILAD